MGFDIMTETYYIQAEIKIKGRYRRLYLWQHDLWRESRSEARLFKTEAAAQAAMARLQQAGRPLRKLQVVHGDETTAPYRRRRHQPQRWKSYKET